MTASAWHGDCDERGMTRRWRRWLTTVCGAGAAVVGLGAWRIDTLGVVDGATPADAIVVLGARVEAGGGPSPTLRARALHAAELYRAHLAPLVVFSGGVGDFGPSEASVARDVVVAQGVPAAACVLEEASHSTRENARLTARVLRERGLHRVLLVSDPYHLARARWLFEREGFDVSTSPTILAPRHRAPLERAWWALREVASFAKDVVLAGLGA